MHVGVTVIDGADNASHAASYVRHTRGIATSGLATMLQCIEQHVCVCSACAVRACSVRVLTLFGAHARVHRYHLIPLQYARSATCAVESISLDFVAIRHVCIGIDIT